MSPSTSKGEVNLTFSKTSALYLNLIIKFRGNKIHIGKSASASQKLITQSIHFSKNFQMVTSNPCKFHQEYCLTSLLPLDIL